VVNKSLRPYLISETITLQPLQWKTLTAGLVRTLGRLPKCIICTPHPSQIRDGFIDTGCVIEDAYPNDPEI
jgi:hypothetical protein